MKVLIISGQDRRQNRPNMRLHDGLLNHLSKFCETKMIMFYGKNPNISSSNYKPDVILMYNCIKRWMKAPRGNYKKIIVDVDKSFKQTNKVKKYLKNNKFDLCIQRGSYSNSDFRDFSCPTVWLPFSADQNEFMPKDMNEKENVIATKFTINKPGYSQRKKMVNILEKNGLIKHKGKNIKDYARILSNSSIGLTSAGKKSPHGKMWEYMASKTVILTPPFNGMIEIFGKNYSDYICVCKEDLSDLVEKAEFLLDNKDERTRLSDNAYKLFLEHHTHEKRAEELYNILKAVYKGKKIPRKWGI